MDFVEACRALIALDSTPLQGNRRVVDWLTQRAIDLGFFVELQEESTGDIPQANIFIRPVQGRPGLEMMYQTRLDTPDPGPFGLWKKNANNPFDAHIIEGHIFGLGAASCKLDFICKLEALTKMKAKNPTWKLPPVLVGTYGCEDGMGGSLKVIRKNMVSCRMAVIGEPSNLQVLSAGKGMARVQIRVPFEADEIRFRDEHNMRESTSTMSKTFQGRSAPSSSPHLGDSAIQKMFQYLEQLPEHISIMEVDGGVEASSVAANAFLEIDPGGMVGVARPMAKKLNRIAALIEDLQSEFLQYSDEDFSPAHPTLNIGRVRTFEGYVDIEGDVRIPAIVSNETYESWMEKATKTCHNVGAEFQVNYYKRPYRTSPESPLVKGALAELSVMNRSSLTGTHSSTNEASLFSRVGIDCISFGPGLRDGNIHTPNENVKVEDLKAATEFYFRLMERFCK